jgi:hypothetical protein
MPAIHAGEREGNLDAQACTAPHGFGCKDVHLISLSSLLV